VISTDSAIGHPNTGSISSSVLTIEDFFCEHTPIETYTVDKLEVDVKREDLYCRDIIAPLAKMRGVNDVMKRLKEEGRETVGVFDFKVSRAGVGIAALAHLLGMKCIECYQHYKAYDSEGLPWQQLKCRDWGAELYPIPASRININYAIGKRYVLNQGGYMFPKGIILEETIDSVASEVDHDAGRLASYDNIIINVGSGTIISGLIKGLLRNGLFPMIYAIACTDSVIHCKRLYRFIDELPRGIQRQLNIRILPSNIEYYSECLVECPFPCHPNYDRKAWAWMLDNIDKLSGRTLFWNIGA